MKIGNFETDNVYCVDCYKAIKDIPDKSIDCIYTDVPYFMPCILDGVAGGKMSKRINRNAKEMENIASGFKLSILKEFVRVMKKINIFVWCNKFQIYDVLDFFKTQNCKYELIVWCKDNPVPMTRNVWLSDVEYCLWFGSKGLTLNDGYDLKSKWFTSAINKRDKDKFNHPTIKPVELVKRHLLHTTQPNDIVLDCFMGSGTTCVAAKDIGRHYIGFEIDSKWFKVAQDRLNNTDANGQTSMFLV